MKYQIITYDYEIIKNGFRTMREAADWAYDNGLEEVRIVPYEEV